MLAEILTIAGVIAIWLSSILDLDEAVQILLWKEPLKSKCTTVAKLAIIIAYLIFGAFVTSATAIVLAALIKS